MGTHDGATVLSMYRVNSSTFVHCLESGFNDNVHSMNQYA